MTFQDYLARLPTSWTPCPELPHPDLRVRRDKDHLCLKIELTRYHLHEKHSVKLIDTLFQNLERKGFRFGYLHLKSAREITSRDAAPTDYYRIAEEEIQ
jgi:hypothetical protein